MTELMMAAGKISSIEDYRGDFPVVISPKYDGYRCYTENRQALSKTSKPIPSLYVQEVLKYLPPGLDGELTVGSNFQSSASVTRKSPDPIPFVFRIFDCFAPEVASYPWNDRIEYANFSVETFKKSRPEQSQHIEIVPHQVVYNLQELIEVFGKIRTKEGAIIRLTNYDYEFGKNSKSLIKVKAFTQSEAMVTRVVQEKYGKNLKTVPPELWGQPKERASVLTCKWFDNGKEFDLGTGFNHSMKKWIWENQEEVVGKIVTFKYILSGTKDRPRHPVFLGFRPEWDMINREAS